LHDQKLAEARQAKADKKAGKKGSMVATAASTETSALAAFLAQWRGQ
jgi:hypothetical protein